MPKFNNVEQGWNSGISQDLLHYYPIGLIWLWWGGIFKKEFYPFLFINPMLLKEKDMVKAGHLFDGLQ